MNWKNRANGMSRLRICGTIGMNKVKTAVGFIKMSESQEVHATGNTGV